MAQCNCQIQSASRLTYLSVNGLVIEQKGAALQELELFMLM